MLHHQLPSDFQTFRSELAMNVYDSLPVHIFRVLLLSYLVLRLHILSR